MDNLRQDGAAQVDAVRLRGIQAATRVRDSATDERGKPRAVVLGVGAGAALIIVGAVTLKRKWR